jgi:asparagine synthase (glutamine-hydrolysing)
MRRENDAEGSSFFSEENIMPNISGFITNDAKFINPDEILKKFKDVHALKGLSFIQKELKTETCMICNTLTGILTENLNQPVSDPVKNVFLFLEGEIYNTDELFPHLHSDRKPTQCEILLELFLKYGDEFVSLLNGEFNIVIVQKLENSITIFNDHLSSKPMYYMEQGETLLFGSEKKSILAVCNNSPIIDPTGLLQIFALSHNLGGRTFIKDIRRLPPQCKLKYKDGKTRLKRLSSLKFRVQSAFGKIDSLVEDWSEHIKQATKRRLKNKNRILINLSGGLDSRALALAIPRNLRPFSARTKGFKNSREVIYAAEIARRLGFNHYIENPGQTIANHIQMKKYADFQMGGAYGNTSSGSAISADMFLPCSRAKFINNLYQRSLSRSKKILNELFNKEFLCKFLPYLKESFFNSMAGLDGDTNIRIFETWSILEKQPQRTLSTALADSHLFEHLRPFIDKSYLNFVMTLPIWLRFGPVLYQTMIFRLGSEISGIPYVNTNLKLRRSVFGNMLNKNIELGLRILKKSVGNKKIPQRFKYRRSDHAGFEKRIREDQAFRYIIERFVASPSFDPSIFNGKGIKNILDKHYGQKADYTFPLCLLATFAVGIPYFITNRCTYCPPEAEPPL